MIRPATPADVAAVVALIAQVHALHVAAMPDRYREPSPDELATWLRGRLAAPDALVLVSEVDGAVLGYMVAHQLDSPAHTFMAARRTVHVDQLGVHADARRGGHGRALMAAIEAHARAWGAVAVTLDAQAFNADARRFYESLGYAVTTLRLGRAVGG